MKAVLMLTCHHNNDIADDRELATVPASHRRSSIVVILNNVIHPEGCGVRSCVGRTLFFTASVLLCSVFSLMAEEVPVEPVTGQPQTSLVYAARREFHLPFSARPRTPGIVGVLYASADGGLSWEFADKALPEEDNFNIRVTTDGRYDFAVRIADTDHLDELTAPTEAELAVIVDTQNPMLTGNAVITLTGKAHIQWSATDVNLAPQTAAVRVRPQDQVKWGAWVSAVTVTRESQSVGRGHFVLDIPEGDSTIELRVRDFAGNECIERFNMTRRVSEPDATVTVSYQAAMEPRAIVMPPLPGSQDSQTERSPPPIQLSPLFPIDVEAEVNPPVTAITESPLIEGNPSPVLSDLELEVMMRAGRNSKALGQLDKSEEYFRNVLRAKPDFTAARRELAGLLQQQNDSESLFHYRHLQESGMWNNEIMKEYANALSSNGLDSEAIYVLSSLLESAPGDISALRSYVYAAIRSGMSADAQYAIDNASTFFLEFTPEEIADLAEMELAVGRPVKALALAEHYNRSGTNQHRMCSVLLRSLSAAKRHGECADEAKRHYDLYSDDSSTWSDVAEELIAGGSHQAADLIIDALPSTDETATSLAILKATSFLRQGRPELAVTAARPHALNGAADANLILASAYHQIGQYSSALSLINVGEFGAKDEFILLRGDIYRDLGCYSRAEQQYRQLQNASKGSLALGRLYQSIGSFDKAAELAMHALHSDRRDVNAWMLYLQAVRSNKGIEAAIEDCNLHIAQENSKLIEAVLRQTLGMLLVDRGEYIAAINEFEKAINIAGIQVTAPQLVLAYYQALNETGRDHDASRVLATSQVTLLASVEMAQNALKRDQLELAGRIIADAIELYPDSVHLKLAHTQLLTQLQDYQSAMSTYRNIISVHPDNEKAELELARLMWRQKNYDDADRIFGEILSRVPQHRIAARDRARMAFRWRGRAESLSIYEEALSAAPEPLSFSTNSMRSLEHLTGRTWNRENTTLELERDAIRLAGWRPENSAAKVEEIFTVSKGRDRFLTDLLASQYDLLGYFGNASRVLTEYESESPGDPSVSAAIRRADAKLDPSAHGLFDYFAQTGRTGLSEITRYDFGAAVRVPYRNESQHITGGYIHRVVTPTSTVAESAYANIITLDSRLQMFDRVYWNSSAALTQFSRGFSTRPEMSNSLEYRLLDGLTWFLNGEISNVIENSETIAQDIYQWQFGPEFLWQMNPDIEVSGQYAFGQLSDRNGFHKGRLGCAVTIFPSPQELRIRGTASFDSYREDTVRPIPGTLEGTVHPYFSPSDFLRGSVIVEYMQSLIDSHDDNNRTYWSVDAGGQMDSFDLFYLIFGGSVHWEICPQLTLNMRSVFILSGDYDSHSAMSSLVYQPWAHSGD